MTDSAQLAEVALTTILAKGRRHSRMISEAISHTILTFKMETTPEIREEASNIIRDRLVDYGFIIPHQDKGAGYEIRIS